MSTEKLTYAIQRAKNNGVTASDVQAIVDDVFGCAVPEVAAEYAEPVEPAETSTDDVEQQ